MKEIGQLVRKEKGRFGENNVQGVFIRLVKYVL